jgi:spoIIIJ-associated protein
MEEAVENILTDLLRAMGISYDALSHSTLAGQTIFSIQTGSAPALIGGRGDTIHALDFLVKKIYEKQQPHTEGEAGPHFLVDVNDYQIKRIKEIQTKAIMMADRARSFQYDVELSPMSAYERLIVHTTLQNEPHIKTESQGEGRNRRVVIKYAGE